EVTSDGSIADLRLAAASRLSRRIALGAGLHLLSGSTRETAERRFDDTTFHTVQQLAEVRYSGVGVSGSLLLAVAPGLSVTGWARADSRLRATVADTTSADTDLPRMAGGGMLFSPSASVRFGGSVAWRGWARAGAGAFDTWSWSAGGEIGAGHMPLRFGVRGGQLPFGPGPTAPTEFAAAAGTGRAFAQGRALRGLARQGERLETVVMGCAAARDGGAIAALPRVRAVVGGADPERVLAAAGLSSPPVPLSAMRRGGTGGRARGLLKIQDGCDEHCTFCATTLARGANRSRAIPELVQEARALAEHHAEIVLTG